METAVTQTPPARSRYSQRNERRDARRDRAITAAFEVIRDGCNSPGDARTLCAVLQYAHDHRVIDDAIVALKSTRTEFVALLLHEAAGTASYGTHLARIVDIALAHTTRPDLTAEQSQMLLEALEKADQHAEVCIKRQRTKGETAQPEHSSHQLTRKRIEACVTILAQSPAIVAGCSAKLRERAPFTSVGTSALVIRILAASQHPDATTALVAIIAARRPDSAQIIIDTLGKPAPAHIARPLFTEHFARFERDKNTQMLSWLGSSRDSKILLDATAIVRNRAGGYTLAQREAASDVLLGSWTAEGILSVADAGAPGDSNARCFQILLNQRLNVVHAQAHETPAQQKAMIHALVGAIAKVETFTDDEDAQSRLYEIFGYHLAARADFIERSTKTSLESTLESMVFVALRESSAWEGYLRSINARGVASEPTEAARLLRIFERFYLRQSLSTPSSLADQHRVSGPHLRVTELKMLDAIKHAPELPLAMKQRIVELTGVIYEQSVRYEKERVRSEALFHEIELDILVGEERTLVRKILEGLIYANLIAIESEALKDQSGDKIDHDALRNAEEERCNRIHLLTRAFGYLARLPLETLPPTPTSYTDAFRCRAGQVRDAAVNSRTTVLKAARELAVTPELQAALASRCRDILLSECLIHGDHHFSEGVTDAVAHSLVESGVLKLIPEKERHALFERAIREGVTTQLRMRDKVDYVWHGEALVTLIVAEDNIAPHSKLANEIRVLRSMRRSRSDFTQDAALARFVATNPIHFMTTWRLLWRAITG